MRKRGNGEGTVFKRKIRGKDIWVTEYKPENSTKKITKYSKSQREGLKKLEKLKKDYYDYKYIEINEIKLKDIMKQLNEDDFNANLISEVTYLRRNETAKIILDKLIIANLPIQKITTKQINDDLLNLCVYSNSTISKVYGMLNRTFNRALILNLISNNFFTTKGLIIKPKSTKPNKKIEALTLDEQKLFISELEKHYDEYTNIFYIAIYTGMRIGEVLALSVDDIDFNNNLIHINKSLTKDKNGKIILGKTTKTYAGTRDIPITSLIKDILIEDIKSKSDTIYVSNEKLINPSTINSHFKRICKNADIKVIDIKKKKHKEDEKSINLKSSSVNTHMLRHTYATRCIESGMSAVVLQKLLGHTDIETTLNTYTSVFNKFKQDEIDKYLEYMNKNK